MTLDLILVGALLVFGLLGWISGFWMQAMRLAALVAAYLLAGLVGRPLGAWLAGGLQIPPLLGHVMGTFIAFLLIYMVLATVGWGVLRRLRRRRSADKARRRRLWDSAAGSLFGMAKAGLILFLLLNAVTLLEKRLSGPLRSAELGYDQSLVVALAREHNVLRGMHLPVVGDVEALSRLSSDPEFRRKVADDPKVQRLLAHPKIKGLLGNRSIVEASERRDVSALMANPQLNEVLEDPEVRALLEDIDLSEIE